MGWMATSLPVPLCWELHVIWAHPHATHHIACLCFQAVIYTACMPCAGLQERAKHLWTASGCLVLCTQLQAQCAAATQHPARPLRLTQSQGTCCLLCCYSPPACFSTSSHTKTAHVMLLPVGC